MTGKRMWMIAGMAAVLWLVSGSAPAETGKTLFNNGISEFQQGRYADAVHWFTRLIEQEPFNAKAYKNRGVAYLSLQKYENAIEDLSSALNLDPELEGVHSNLGAAYHYQQSYQKAIDEYGKEIDHHPENYSAYFNRALSWVQLREYENALRDLKKVLSIKPDEYWALSYQGDLFAELKNFEAARGSYEKAVGLHTGNGYAENKLSMLDTMTTDVLETPVETAGNAVVETDTEVVTGKIVKPAHQGEQNPPEHEQAVDSEAPTDHNDVADINTAPTSAQKRVKIPSPVLKKAKKHADRSHKAGRFTVQLGAFLDAANAEHLVQLLEQKGFPPHTLQLTDKKSRQWTLVRTGYFETRNDAVTKATEIRTTLQKDAVVRPVGRF